jgi:hypothetical protein
MCASARSKASSDVSGGGKKEAPGTCAQPAHAAYAIQNFQYYASPTGHIAFWNEGPKIPTNQPEARELQKADGLPAITNSLISFAVLLIVRLRLSLWIEHSVTIFARDRTPQSRRISRRVAWT